MTKTEKWVIINCVTQKVICETSCLQVVEAARLRCGIVMTALEYRDLARCYQCGDKMKNDDCLRIVNQLRYLNGRATAYDKFTADAPPVNGSPLPIWGVRPIIDAVEGRTGFIVQARKDLRHIYKRHFRYMFNDYVSPLEAEMAARDHCATLNVKSGSV